MTLDLKEETPLVHLTHTITRAFSGFHASLMANAATSRAKKPFATMWDADPGVKVGFAPVAVVDAAAAIAVDGKGVPVATAPTPPVTGPLSVICESSREDDERLGSLWK